MLAAPGEKTTQEDSNPTNIFIDQKFRFEWLSKDFKVLLVTRTGSAYSRAI